VGENLKNPICLVIHIPWEPRRWWQRGLWATCFCTGVFLRAEQEQNHPSLLHVPFRSLQPSFRDPLSRNLSAQKDACEKGYAHSAQWWKPEKKSWGAILLRYGNLFQDILCAFHVRPDLFNLIETRNFHQNLHRESYFIVSLKDGDRKVNRLYYCPTGWIPEGASSAQPFRGLLHKSQQETGVSRSWGSTLIALNAGLMKPRKGFTPVTGKKNSDGQIACNPSLWRWRHRLQSTVEILVGLGDFLHCPFDLRLDHIQS